VTLTERVQHLIHLRALERQALTEATTADDWTRGTVAHDAINAECRELLDDGRILGCVMDCDLREKTRRYW